MAISADEANKLTTEELKLVDELEKYIDQYLLEHYSGEKITIRFPDDYSHKRLSKRASSELKNRYVSVAWERVEVMNNTITLAPDSLDWRW